MIAITRHLSTPDPLLLPDRDEPYVLQDVYEKIVDGCRDEIVLDFGDSYLRFIVNIDSDTVGGQFHEGTFVVKRGYGRIGSETPWKKYLNKDCGWTWLAINQQGYWDTILISFDAVVPNLLLSAMASSIYVFKIGPMEKIIAEKSATPKNKKKIVRKI